MIIIFIIPSSSAGQYGNTHRPGDIKRVIFVISLLSFWMFFIIAEFSD